MDIRPRGRLYEVRWARESEWSPAMKLVWKTFLQYEGKDYTQEGIRHFFDFITNGDLYVSFLKGEYQMMVALMDRKIIGVGTLRGGNYLSLLFVDERYHHMGVGSAILGRLCDYLKTEAGQQYISLQAAPYAVDFYKKQGFLQIQPEMEFAGIRVTTMKKQL